MSAKESSATLSVLTWAFASVLSGIGVGDAVVRNNCVGDGVGPGVGPASDARGGGRKTGGACLQEFACVCVSLHVFA